VDAGGLADLGSGLLLQQMKTQDAHLVLRTALTTYFLFHATGSFPVVPRSLFAFSGHFVFGRTEERSYSLKRKTRSHSVPRKHVYGIERKVGEILIP
jgi:hypothetical protein